MATYDHNRNDFVKFYATMSFSIGVGSDAVKISIGDEFEYDGTLVKYAGREISSPQTRSAIKAGWASIDRNNTTMPSAIKPIRDRAKSQSVNTNLSSVQRTNVAIETDNMDEDTVMSVSDRRDQNAGSKVLNVSTNTAQPRKMVASRGMEVVSDEDQHGVSVGRVRTPAKRVVNDMHLASASSVIEDIQNIKGSGFIPNGNTIKSSGITMTSSVTCDDSSFGDEDSGVVVAQVNKSSKTKPAPKVQEKPINVSVSPRVRIARAIDPGFPADWDFTGKLAERMARVKSHGATSQFIEALYAAEGDQMRKLLEKEFPKQFAG